MSGARCATVGGRGALGGLVSPVPDGGGSVERARLARVRAAPTWAREGQSNGRDDHARLTRQSGARIATGGADGVVNRNMVRKRRGLGQISAHAITRSPISRWRWVTRWPRNTAGEGGGVTSLRAHPTNEQRSGSGSRLVSVVNGSMKFSASFAQTNASMFIMVGGARSGAGRLRRRRGRGRGRVVVVVHQL